MMKDRLILLATIVVATPAIAGDSVLTFKQLSDDADSIRVFSCGSCPPLKEEQKDPGVHGVEVIETMIGGQKKIVQTDNLMGGSAVRYVKSSPSNAESAGEMIAHTEGGTDVTVGREGTIHVRPNLQPVSADMGRVTYGGGGEFHLQNADADEEPNAAPVDRTSRTSSIDMDNAEHAVLDGQGARTAAGEAETEILELRPTH